MIRRLSSRATIAAGTRPPRVMHTTAWNGPTSTSRQASARASRWNASQDTGKIFSSFCGIANLRGSDQNVRPEPRIASGAAESSKHPLPIPPPQRGESSVRPAPLVEERIATDHRAGMRLLHLAERAADVALARVGPHRRGKHFRAGLERRRDVVEHRLHNGGHARHDEHVADAK